MAHGWIYDKANEGMYYASDVNVREEGMRKIRTSDDSIPYAQTYDYLFKAPLLSSEISSRGSENLNKPPTLSDLFFVDRLYLPFLLTVFCRHICRSYWCHCYYKERNDISTRNPKRCRSRGGDIIR